MNSVYIRMLLYVLATPLAAAGFGVFDPLSGTLTLHADDIAAAIGTSSVLSGLVFSIWGTK